MAEDPLQGWIKDQVERTDVGKRCEAFVLRQVSPSRAARGDLQRVSVPAKPSKEFPLNAMNALLRAADQDCRALGGVQTYSVAAIFAGIERPVAQQAFRRSAPEVDESALDPSLSEPANAEGLTAQTMRHNEALMKMATSGAQATIQSLMNLLRDRDALLADYQRREMERIQQVEELATAKHERAMARAAEAAKERRTDELLGMAKPLVATIANKVAGVKMLPGGVQEGDGIRTLLASITEPQMQQLMEVLTPMQLMALKTMYDEMQKALPVGEDTGERAPS